MPQAVGSFGAFAILTGANHWLWSETGNIGAFMVYFSENGWSWCKLTKNAAREYLVCIHGVILTDVSVQGYCANFP